MREGEQGPVPGNAEVVALLERWLEVAKEGEACYAALAMIKMPNLMIVDFVGATEVEMAIEHALDQVKAKIAAAKKRRNLPPRDPNVTADHVTYNVAHYPLSFDFVPWLIDAEMERRRASAPAPLKVNLWTGPGICHNAEFRRGWLANVVRPALALIGAVEEEVDAGGRSADWFTYRDVTANAKAGVPIPHFKAPEEAMAKVAGWLEGGPAPVTITLREAEYWPHRNSNMVAWLAFGAELERRGERVIYVRDTAKAEEPLLNCETCPLASIDLHTRYALYEQAKCNLFVPNGPWCLALFGTKPWLMFNKITKGDLFLPNTPGWWEKFQGIQEGGQFPWQQSDQRIVWASDDYDTIITAWQQLYPLLAKAA